MASYHDFDLLEKQARSDKRRRVRVKSVLALGNLGQNDRVELLLRELVCGDADDQVRAAAAVGLEKQATLDPSVRMAMVVRDDPVQVVRRSLMSAIRVQPTSPEAERVLLSIPETGSDGDRAALARALGTWESDSSLSVLVDLLRSSDRRTRIAAFNALCRRNEPSVRDALSDATEAERRPLRWAFQRGLRALDASSNSLRP